METDPLTTTVLEPFTLVMRYAKCYYCGSHNYNDIYIGDRFGIRHCTDHTSWAKRDCDAYLHGNEMVRLEDLDTHPILKQFKDGFSSGISILRSSGVLEGGWTIYKNITYLEHAKLIVKKGGDWLVPVEERVTYKCKHVPIATLGYKENGDKFPSELLSNVIDILEHGIYKNAYECHENLKQLQTGATVAEEHPLIHPCIFQGTECRILEYSD